MDARSLVISGENGENLEEMNRVGDQQIGPRETTDREIKNQKNQNKETQLEQSRDNEGKGQVK